MKKQWIVLAAAAAACSFAFGCSQPSKANKLNLEKHRVDLEKNMVDPEKNTMDPEKNTVDPESHTVEVIEEE